MIYEIYWFIIERKYKKYKDHNWAHKSYFDSVKKRGGGNISEARTGSVIGHHSLKVGLPGRAIEYPDEQSEPSRVLINAVASKRSPQRAKEFGAHDVL